MSKRFDTFSICSQILFFFWHSLLSLNIPPLRVDSDLVKHQFTVISTCLYQDSQCIFLPLCIAYVYRAFICLFFFFSFYDPNDCFRDHMTQSIDNFRITTINDLRKRYFFFSSWTCAASQMFCSDLWNSR